MVSQHELYVHVRFRRSSVFPTLLFLGTDQNGMTVNENTTADKISSTYRNSWNSSNFPRKFFLRRWFCRCMCINSPILSGVILHFIRVSTHAPWTSKFEILFLITSWSQLRCSAYLPSERVFSKFLLLQSVMTPGIDIRY